MRINVVSERVSLDAIVALMFFASLMIPYISYTGRGDVASYAVFLFWTLLIVIKKRNIFRLFNILVLRKTELICLFAFLGVTLFTYFFLTPTPKAFQFVLMPLMYLALVVMDSFYLGHAKLRLFILSGLILICGVQAAVSIPYVYNSDEMVSRLFTQGELEGVDLEQAVLHGVGSPVLYVNLIGLFYLGISSLPMFAGRILRLLLIASLVCILTSILLSSYTNAYTMLLFGLAVIAVKTKWPRVNKAYVFCIIAILVAVPVLYSTVLADSQLMEPIRAKLDLIREGNLREDGRMDLASVSYNTFLEHPIFGVGVPNWSSYTVIGEHMPWIDFAAHYGFVGFFPFLLFIAILFYRNAKFYLKGHQYATSCFVGFAIFIVSDFVNPFIFQPSFIMTLIFFYTSISNWKVANIK